MKNKPCPFCGSSNIDFQFGTNSSKWGAVICSRCGVQGPEVRTNYDASENAPWHEDALREWNAQSSTECAASPWCYDMSQAPRDGTKILVKISEYGYSDIVSYDNQYDVWCGGENEYYTNDIECFATINLPKKED